MEKIMPLYDGTPLHRLGQGAWYMGEQKQCRLPRKTGKASSRPFG